MSNKHNTDTNSKPNNQQRGNNRNSQRNQQKQKQNHQHQNQQNQQRGNTPAKQAVDTSVTQGQTGDQQKQSTVNPVETSAPVNETPSHNNVPETKAQGYTSIEKIEDVSDLVGRFVEDNGEYPDTHYVTYVSVSKKWAYASGRGKQILYPISIEDIASFSEKVELVSGKIFTSEYTYLTDGNNLYRIARREDDSLSLMVAAESKNTRSWKYLQDIVYMHQVPATVRQGDGIPNDIIILAESDEQISDLALSALFESQKVVRTVNTSDFEARAEDFAAADFQLCYCF